jgi:hypothetical protein
MHARTICLMLAALLAAGVTACSSNADADPSPSPAASRTHVSATPAPRDSSVTVTAAYRAWIEDELRDSTNNINAAAG